MSTHLKLGFSMAGESGKFEPRPQNVASNSARVAEAERSISRLEQENNRLLSELNDLRALYKQLTTESSHESFDERRVNLLKSQVIQLERQNALLTQTISSRSETLMDAENALAATIDYCQSVMAQKERTREVHVSYTEFQRIITTLESARKQLCRMADKTSSIQSYSKPLLWYGSFLRNRPDPPVTLFDICRGDIEHINLKHVGRLESKLVNLYKELTLVNNSLRICVQSRSVDDGVAAAPTAVYSRLSDQAQHSCDLLQDVCSQLLQLSLLVPAAPFPALNKPPFEQLSVENVVKVFGKSAKSRDARKLIEALLKYVNISVSHAGIENKLLLEELEFHHAIYRLENQYVESLFSSMTKCYSEFESDMQEVICQPLKEVLQVFDELKECASNHSILHFIEVFQTHATGLSEIVQRLSADASSHSDRSRQLSEYGTQFLKRMKQCHAGCKRERDQHIVEIDSLKQQLSEQTKELIQIIGETDQQLNRKEGSSPSDKQAHCMSNPEQSATARSTEINHRLSEIKCTCRLEDTSTTVDKTDEFATFSSDIKSSALAVPSPVAKISSVLPGTSVSVIKDRPPVCKQVGSKRTTQHRQVLKPNWDNSFHCTESLSPAKSADNCGRNIVITRSTSFFRDIPPLDPSLTQQSDSDCGVANLTGRRSGRTPPSTIKQSSSFCRVTYK